MKHCRELLADPHGDGSGLFADRDISLTATSKPGPGPLEGLPRGSGAAPLPTAPHAQKFSAARAMTNVALNSNT
jgi:hypothetical protein